MTKLEELLQNVRDEIGADLVGSDIVGVDGFSVAGFSVDPNLNREAISAHFALAMKLALTVCEKLNLGELEDNLVTADKHITLCRSLGDGSYFWILDVKKDATLGIVRLTMNDYAPKLWEAIPR
jgi:predicted regulator of Ras-like GTPase activity (Roadblock/LC7/MglB family)